MRNLAVPPYVVHICRLLHDAGYKAFVVGGGVRDALLGRRPKDWDVATDATPSEVRSLFPRTIPVGIEFGTVIVIIDGGEPVEVTTFRGETGYEDGRRPDRVEFIGRIEDDLVRRDFTVNALAYDPITDVIVDPYRGRADLQARTLRAVGEASRRFSEDGLRVLRGVRLATELKFDIEPATGRALRAHGPRLEKISRERIGQEWRRLLLGPEAGRGLQLLARYELLRFVFPLSEGESRDCMWDGKGVGEVARVLSSATVNTEDIVTKTATFLYRWPRRDLHRGWLRGLVYPRAEARAALNVVAGMHELTMNRPADTVALRRFLQRLGRPCIPAFTAAWRAWHPDDGADVAPRTERILLAGDALHVSELAVDGHDLQSALHVASGRAIGRLLDALLEHVSHHPEDNTRPRLLEVARARQQAL